MAKYVCNVCGIEFFTATDCCKHKKLVHDLNFSQCNRCGDFLPQEDVVCFESYSFCHDCVQLLPGQKTSDTSSCISETELDCNRLVDKCETLLDCREKIFPPKEQEEKNICFDFSNCNSSNFFDCPPMTDNSETDFNCLKLKKAKKLLTVKNCFYCDECQQEFLDAFRYYSHDCDQVSNSEQISQSSKSLNDLTVATKRFSNSKSRKFILNQFPKKELWIRYKDRPYLNHIFLKYNLEKVVHGIDQFCGWFTWLSSSFFLYSFF